MYNHAPENYICPLCLAVEGIENDNTLVKQSDIFFRDDLITAFISSFLVGKNPGHIIIIPNKHFENLYDMPDVYISRVHTFSKDAAYALKNAYNCDGTSISQHNEPAGDQHAWHYHLHIVPRYPDDELYKAMYQHIQGVAKRPVLEPEKRAEYAGKLKHALKELHD
jgi:histidine triad (HIT) family protein